MDLEAFEILKFLAPIALVVIGIIITWQLNDIHKNQLQIMKLLKKESQNSKDTPDN